MHADWKEAETFVNGKLSSLTIEAPGFVFEAVQGKGRQARTAASFHHEIAQVPWKLRVFVVCVNCPCFPVRGKAFQWEAGAKRSCVWISVSGLASVHIHESCTDSLSHGLNEAKTTLHVALIYISEIFNQDTDSEAFDGCRR